MPTPSDSLAMPSAVRNGAVWQPNRNSESNWINRLLPLPIHDLKIELMKILRADDRLVLISEVQTNCKAGWLHGAGLMDSMASAKLTTKTESCGCPARELSLDLSESPLKRRWWDIVGLSTSQAIGRTSLLLANYGTDNCRPSTRARTRGHSWTSATSVGL